MVAPYFNRAIVGYDPDNGITLVEHRIPSSKYETIFALVSANPNDPDLVYNYEVSPPVAESILRLIGQNFVQSLKYYLSCEKRW